MRVLRVSNAVVFGIHQWVVGNTYEVVEEDKDPSTLIRFRVETSQGYSLWDYNENWEVVPDEPFWKTLREKI